MTIDPVTLIAILAMAAATIATRLSGLFLHRMMFMSDERRRVLDAIPPAVLAAVVTPTALATGWAETLACAVTALAAKRLPFLAALCLGITSVAVLRRLGL
ncbi:AzlD family protein [Agrobacterium sp. ES01]|uniref:AzlD family protein n=1 Tax=Agrobacterium sp. ES01 TaxID=3420714 RepID=UPI003D10AC22